MLEETDKVVTVIEARKCIGQICFLSCLVSYGIWTYHRIHILDFQHQQMPSSSMEIGFWF